MFETLRFDDRFRRVGDTEFGLKAERAGFRVSYAPAMRVDHDHEEDLGLFAAKQICHGWVAQRLMQADPEVAWHGGHLKTVAKVSRWMAPIRGTSLLAKACARMAILNAGLLQPNARWIPERPAFWWLTGIDKLAALAGHLAYRPGAPDHRLRNSWDGTCQGTDPVRSLWSIHIGRARSGARCVHTSSGCGPPIPSRLFGRVHVAESSLM